MPQTSIDVVGPDVLTGTSVAAIWSEALGREVVYAGDDTRAFERAVGAHAPGWMAYDMKVMADRFQSDGMLPEEGDVDRLVGHARPPAAALPRLRRRDRRPLAAVRILQARNL